MVAILGCHSWVLVGKNCSCYHCHCFLIALEGLVRNLGEGSRKHEHAQPPQEAVDPSPRVGWGAGTPLSPPDIIVC